MKILYITRMPVKSNYGGAEGQIASTMRYLISKYKDLSIECVSVDRIDGVNFNDYDIIHFWDVQIITQDLLNKTAHNNKTVCSSIFWDFTDSIMINYLYLWWYYLPLGIYQVLKIFAIYISKHVLYNLLPCYSKRKETLFLHAKSKKLRNKVIKSMNIIIPNSDEEGTVLCKHSFINPKEVQLKCSAIPNAVDTDYLRKHNDNAYMSDVKDYVLLAGRIEPLKNQLGLISALMNMPQIPIIIAGGVGESPKYYETVKKLAKKRGNVYFTGKISHDDLFSLYKRAKVHVLASFRESPGLATLEALMCGSQIVVSEEKFCPIKYYQFDKYGFVCNPYDVKSIRKAVLEAYNYPKDISLPEEYIKFFSYENVANMTYEIYDRIINEK